MKRLLSNKAYKKIIITATLFFILILSINSCAQKTVEQMKADKDIESLIKALDSSDEKIRSEAVIVLGDIGDVSTLEVLIKSLNDEDSNVRKNAAIALGKIGNSKAITPLIEALKDKDLNVRKEAIIALENIGGEKAVEILLQKLKDENSVIRSNSADALVNIGEPAVNSLIKLLKDEDINLRDSVIYVLKKVGDIALEPFIKNLKDENWDVRIEAAEYLDLLEWKPKDDVQKAYYFIAKKDWDEAANLGEPAVEPLIKAIKYLKYEDYENRRFAAITLTKIGEPAVEPLIQALEDKDEYVRRWASWTLWTLGYVGDERAIPPKITEVSEYDITHTITLVNDGPFCYSHPSTCISNQRH